MSVLIVGAGPSGAYLSILLAKKGIETILIDRLDNPYNNAYSSAALPEKLTIGKTDLNAA